MFDLSLLVDSLGLKIVKISFCTPPVQAVLSPFLSLSPFFFLFSLPFFFLFPFSPSLLFSCPFVPSSFFIPFFFKRRPLETQIGPIGWPGELSQQRLAAKSQPFPM